MENIFIARNEEEYKNSIDKSYLKSADETYLTHRELHKDFTTDSNISILRLPLDNDKYDLINNKFNNILIYFFYKKNSNNAILLDCLKDDIFDANIGIIKNNNLTDSSDSDNSKIIYKSGLGQYNDFDFHSTSKENLLYLFRDYKNKLDHRFFYDKELPAWYRRLLDKTQPEIIEQKISTELYEYCLKLDNNGLFYKII